MARESHAFGGLNLNDGISYTVLAHTFKPAQETPDLIGGPDSEGGLLLEEPKPEPLVHEMLIRVVRQATADLAAAKVSALVHRFAECAKQPGGLADVWTPQDLTTSWSIYVLHAQVTEVPREAQDVVSRSPVLRVVMVCKPYLYGPEVTGMPVTSTLPAFVVTVADVPGHVPAEGRLIVTENNSQPRRHVEWGLESRHLNAALPTILDSDSLVVAGHSGTQTTLSGAYDPGASGNSIIVSPALASLPVAVCGTGSQSHIGSFKVKARVQASALDVDVRLMFRAGDNAFGETATGYVTVHVEDAYAEVDLGDVTIPPKVLGTQSWEGRIDARADTAGATLHVDYLIFIPIDEGYGKARSVYTYQPGGRVALDEFTSTTSGNALHGRVATLGGSWATSGAATDFVFADLPAAAETITRTANGNARIALLGSTDYTDIEVSVRVRREAVDATQQGPLVRGIDANNFVNAYVRSSDSTLRIESLVGGGGATIAAGPAVAQDALTWYEIRLVAFASGFCVATMLDADGVVLAVVSGVSAVVATGGALATGKPGIHDQSTGAVVRYYDDFYAATPPAEPLAINSGQSIEFRHDGCIRENVAGTIWGAPWYRGSRVLIPQAGYQDRDSQILVKARRNDVDVASDPNIADSTTAQVNYTPRYRMPAP